MAEWQISKRMNAITKQWQWSVWNLNYDNRVIYSWIENSGVAFSADEADEAMSNYLAKIKQYREIQNGWGEWDERIVE